MATINKSVELKHGQVRHQLDIICDCKWVDHDVRIVAMNDDMDDPYPCDVYIVPTLKHYRPWYKRIGIAFRYLFGIDNTYCSHVECGISDQQTIDEIIEFLNTHKVYLPSGGN